MRSPRLKPDLVGSFSSDDFIAHASGMKKIVWDGVTQ